MSDNKKKTENPSATKIADERKTIDSNLLRTVANEILSDSDSDEDDIAMLSGEIVEEEISEDDQFTQLMGGEAALDERTPTKPPEPESTVAWDPNKITAKPKIEVAKSKSPKKKSLFKKRLPLGEVLVNHSVISRKDLEYALKFQSEQARDKKIGHLLLQLKLIPNEKYGMLVNALLAQLKSSEVNLEEIGQFVDLELSERFKSSRMEKELFFPLRIVEDRGSRTLDVFMENDADLYKLDELAAIFNVSRVRPVGKFEHTLLKQLLTEMAKTKASEIMPEDQERITLLETPDAEDVDNEAIARGRDDNYISRITDKIIYDGVKLGASDIHIEYGDVPRVRYRIDGILQEGGWISTEDYPSVISRLKILAEMDITERRVPQDGNIRLGIEGMGVIDFRVNTLPASGNEKVVLRILDSNKLHSLTLDMLGFPEPMLESFIDNINRTQGMVLITGPTGSGKSTTLYSALLYLLETKGKELNISTAEDPIEYRVEGLNQSQLNEKVGLTFPQILKALLRQDPDIILVGEIRDLETAGLGIKASQTGHLVLSTLHTNTAVATLSRLVNMGIESYMVADTLLAIMNQRLARRICPNCQETYEPSAKELALIPSNQRAEWEFIRGRGCDHCNYRGYKGRLGFYEYLKISRDVRRMIMDKKTEEEILLHAQEEGFLTMREFGILKAKEGLTTLEEVLHHTIDPLE